MDSAQFLFAFNGTFPLGRSGNWVGRTWQSTQTGSRSSPKLLDPRPAVTSKSWTAGLSPNLLDPTRCHHYDGVRLDSAQVLFAFIGTIPLGRSGNCVGRTWQSTQTGSR
ncbi:hypothetical protein AMTRI_Chr10g231780 [Amborella trichopoda]